MNESDANAVNSISTPDISDSGILATPPLYGSGSVAWNCRFS